MSRIRTRPGPSASFTGVELEKGVDRVQHKGDGQQEGQVLRDTDLLVRVSGATSISLDPTRNVVLCTRSWLSTSRQVGWTLPGDRSFIFRVITTTCIGSALVQPGFSTTPLSCIGATSLLYVWKLSQLHSTTSGIGAAKFVFSGFGATTEIEFENFVLDYSG